MYLPKLYPGPTIQSRFAAWRAAKDLVVEMVRSCQNCEIRSSPNADTNECKILKQGHEKRSDEKS